MEILFIFIMIGTSPASFICFSRPARLEVLPWCTAMKLTFYLLHRRSKISRYLLVLFQAVKIAFFGLINKNTCAFRPLVTRFAISSIITKGPVLIGALSTV
jgi:hypothetical protein